MALLSNSAGGGSVLIDGARHLCHSSGPIENESKVPSALTVPPTVRATRTLRSHGGRFFASTDSRQDCQFFASALNSERKSEAKACREPEIQLCSRRGGLLRQLAGVAPGPAPRDDFPVAERRAHRIFRITESRQANRAARVQSSGFKSRNCDIVNRHRRARQDGGHKIRRVPTGGEQQFAVLQPVHWLALLRPFPTTLQVVPRKIIRETAAGVFLHRAKRGRGANARSIAAVHSRPLVRAKVDSVQHALATCENSSGGRIGVVQVKRSDLCSSCNNMPWLGHFVVAFPARIGSKPGLSHTARAEREPERHAQARNYTPHRNRRCPE